MKFQNFLALARKTFQKPIFVAGARNKKVDFFTFALFYKQTAFIYARKIFNATKMYTYTVSPEKLAWHPVNFGLRPGL